MGLPYNERLTEALALLVGLRPQVVVPSTVLTPAIDTRQLKRVLFVLDVPTVGSSATVDFKLQSSATSGGSYADIAGSSITQLVAAGVVTVELRAETLQQLATPVGPFVKASTTVAVANCTLGVSVIGAPSDNSPTGIGGQSQTFAQSITL